MRFSLYLGWLVFNVFLLGFAVVGTDRERMGREGHDGGGLPGHRGHEVRVAILWKVRTLPCGSASKKGGGGVRV